jgi:hypothetical protein
MPQFGGKPKKKSSDSKRHFRVIMGNKEHGLYISSTPSSAARKAVTKLCATNKSKKVEFYIREITKGSKKKTYGPYEGHIEKLKEPIELKGRIIHYKPVVKLSRKYFMKGGNERLLREMREFRGEFILILGSTRRNPWFIDFERLPENSNKKVISIDLNEEIENNFKWDFNDENTWIQLQEFNGRFYQVIFDYSVDKFINPENSFDIISKIRNLLMVNGRFYKYLSYGSVFIPNDIKKACIDRELSESDIKIIESQIDINRDDKSKILGIKSYKICKTDYGFCYYLSSAMNFSGLITVHDLNNQDANYKQRYFSSIHKYIKSMYHFYNDLYFVNLLQKKYGFLTTVEEECVSYPLKNPNIPRNKVYNLDNCYVICTKI